MTSVIEGDMDLFYDEIDEDQYVKDNEQRSEPGKKKRATEEGKEEVEFVFSEDGDLWKPYSHEDNVKFMFKTFRVEYMHNPSFH
jgi:hypothetical protein